MRPGPQPGLRQRPGGERSPGGEPRPRRTSERRPPRSRRSVPTRRWPPRRHVVAGVQQYPSSLLGGVGVRDPGPDPGCAMAAPYTLPALSRSMNADYLARVTVAEAAAPGLAPSTPHRWLGDGFIASEHGAQAGAGCTGSFPGMADRPLRWSVDPA